MNTEEAARIICKHAGEELKIYTHIDADGICSGAIISKALDRENIAHKTNFVKQLEPKVIGGLEPDGLTIFCDLGSGQLDYLEKKFSGKDVLIADHHQPGGRGWETLVHVNPHLQGYNGGSEISAAGVCYLIAKQLNKKNVDLSPIAIVGAVGDVQNLWGKFEGLNRKIVEDAVGGGFLKARTDLQIYGKQTRPVFKALQYFTDPYLPGVSNNEGGAIQFLKHCGIRLKDEKKWRAYIDLDIEEKQRLGTEIIKKALSAAPAELKKYVQNLIVGEVYEILTEQRGTELREADEYSTAMNACGRNGHPEVGLQIAKGNRDYYPELASLIAMHRKNLALGIEAVEKSGIVKERGLQYFDARGKIKETLVGTIAGMVLGSEYTDPYKPILAFAQTEGGIKISARCSRLLSLKGINLGKIMRETCAQVGGTGGGHAMACGGYIPEGEMEKFLQYFGEKL